MSRYDLRQVDVVLDVEALGRRRMGVLHRQAARGGDVYSFEFDADWLARRDPITLDPDLLSVPGRTYPRAGRTQFGIFMDSAPDRWGRTLMQRREALQAAQAKRAVRTLTDWDYLLGVHDYSRSGALRFRADEHAPFLDDAPSNAAPPLTSLRELQAAARVFEEDPGNDDEQLRTVLEQLLAPGSSLGGARPKASVLDEEGRLCIAKFPSVQDAWDVGAWETVAHRLARRAGVQVPVFRSMSFTAQGHTFIAQRFDRSGSAGRLAFVSAMTLLQRSDGEMDASYLELVDLLQSRGAQTQRDCEELFRRVVLSICISNTDDHLRNHGFIIGSAGLELSPVFDINPNPHRRQLSLAIDETTATLSLEIAEAAAGYYGLGLARAREIIDQVRTAARHWQREAKALGIAAREQEFMRPAFLIADPS